MNNKETILNSMIEVNKYFSYNYSLKKTLDIDMKFIKKIIQSINYNIENLYLIDKINNHEYKEYIEELNKINIKNQQIFNKIKMKNIINGTFHNLKLQMNEIIIELKQFTLNCSSCKIIDMINLFYNNEWYKNIDKHCYNKILFYNKIFNSTTCLIENIKYYEKEITNQKEGFIFFKKNIGKT